MNYTVTCPWCGEEMTVQTDKQNQTITCACGAQYEVSLDAEFVDGMWRDLTHLHQTN